MTGSLGMVASTLPVQWLMPLVGWRGIFIALPAMLIIAILVIFVLVPAWKTELAANHKLLQARTAPDYSYTAVWANAYVRSLIPMGFFFYGGVIAMQTLWVAPWMIKVSGYSALEAATALFYINVVMLFTFWLWGTLNPWLVRKNISSDKLMIFGLPTSFIVLAIIIIAANVTNTPANGIFSTVLSGLNIHSGVLWAVYFVTCSFMALSQPAIAMAFPAELAGRALSAFNLVLFAGVFVMQWGIGLLIESTSLARSGCFSRRFCRLFAVLYRLLRVFPIRKAKIKLKSGHIDSIIRYEQHFHHRSCTTCQCHARMRVACVSRSTYAHCCF
jgi:hypothetical protein